PLPISADGIKFNGSTATIFLNCINYLLNHTLYGKFQRFPNTNYNEVDRPRGVNFTANERMWVSNVLLKTKDDIYSRYCTMGSIRSPLYVQYLCSTLN